MTEGAGYTAAFSVSGRCPVLCCFCKLLYLFFYCCYQSLHRINGLLLKIRFLALRANPS